MLKKILISVVVCICSLAFTFLVFSVPDFKIKPRGVSNKRNDMVLMPTRPKPFDNTMPSLTPNPNIDYKILRVQVSESFDYKIHDASPRPRVPDDITSRRKIIAPKFR